MGSVQTGIQLQDNFTNVILGIINSVNLAVSAMDDMNTAMNSDIDTTAIQAARNEIRQATAAANQLNAALDDISPRIRSPAEPVPVPAPDPVTIPAVWQSHSLEVFTNTGAERFQQELQSANTMMQQLSSTQNTIARQVAGISILPPGASQDFSSLAARIDAIRARIQQLESNPMNINTDAANTELEQLRGMLNHTLTAQEALNNAMQGMDAGAINESYLRLSQTVGNTERYIRDNVDEQGRFNRAVQDLRGPVTNAETGFKGWQKAIIVANQGISLIRGTLGRLGVTDMSGAFNRIDTMNRFQKTITIMTGDANMANAALEQLKSTTLGTAYGLDVAAKSTQGFLTRGMSLGTAADQVRIWMDAVSFYGQGTNEQLENVIDAVGKIYSKGTVEAAQLDRLFDAGIGAAEMYAQAVGRSVSEVKDDLTNRKISSAEFLDTVTKAMDAGVSANAAKNAGDSWAVTIANMRAAVTRGWISVIENVDTALASQGLPSSMEMVAIFGQKMESALNTVGNAMFLVVGAAANVGEVLGTAGSFIADNWSVIGPVVYGVAAALSVYYGWQMAANGISVVSKGIHTAMAAAQMIHSAATGSLTAATAAEIAAQNGLNAAMFACPITWIIMLVIALIAIFYAAVAAVNKFAGTTISATGVICGVIATAAAVVANIFIGLANAVIGIGIEIYNLIASFANFFANVFNDPVGAIMSLFADLFDFIAGIVQSAAKLIDTVLGSDLSGAVAGFRENFAGAVNDLIGEQTVVMETKNAADYQLDRIAYGDAWDAGYSFGEGLENKIANFSIDDLIGTADVPAAQDYSGLLDDANGLAGQTADNTGDAAKQAKRAADSVAISSEDLKYLRDIAERETINRFTTAEITVHQTNHNSINNNMDLDGVTEHLRATMEEQMAAAAEGAH